MRQLCKGNIAVIKGAILAGCRGYYGYPITPASEIAEAAALYFPQVGGTFLQAESETAAINMVYGAAATGVRVMSGSSGPGLSLMQEGMSYLAGAELPCVIVDVMRGGPGLGNKAITSRWSRVEATATTATSCWRPHRCKKWPTSRCWHLSWPTNIAIPQSYLRTAMLGR